MKFKNYLVVMLILSTIFMTGCWDKVEIDKKAFASIIGIDPGEDIGKEKQLKSIDKGSSFSESEFKKIRTTYSFPNLSNLGPEKGGQAEQNNMTVDAYSMEDSVNKITNKSSRIISFGHLKLIILNISILDYSNTFKELMDYLQRQPAINRMVYIALCEDKSEEILNYKPSIEKSIGNYITGTLENNKKNNTAFPLTLNDFLQSNSKRNSSLLPVINIDKKNKELKISKVAVIKNNKIKGYLSSEQANKIQLVNKEFKGGTVSLIRDGSPLDYSIESAERKIRLVNKKNLKFDIELNIEGQIKGYNVDKQIASKEDIRNIEIDLNKAIEKEIKEAIRISQVEYNTDILGLGEYVHKYHPGLWKELKDKWDDLYKTLDIKVNVDTKIRRIGAIK